MDKTLITDSLNKQNAAPKALYALSKAEFFAALVFINASSSVTKALLAYFFGDRNLSLAEGGAMCGLSKQSFFNKVRLTLNTAAKFQTALTLYENYLHLIQDESELSQNPILQIE